MTRTGSDLPTADLAPTGRAKCIHCSQAIEKQSVRIAIPREIDTGSFVTTGPGYLHPGCAAAWSETGWEAGLADLIEQVRSHSGLDSLPPPFGAAGTESPAAKTAASKPQAPAPVVPPFDSLTSKDLTALATKLQKLKDSYKADALLEKSGVQWGRRAPLCWHLVQHALIEPTHLSVLFRLGETAADADGDAVFAAIPRLGKATRGTLDLLPGWSQSADLIVLRAMALDPDRLCSLRTGATALLRMGIDLVRGRCGAVLRAEEGSSVLDGLAACEAKDYGLPRSYSAQGERLVVASLGAQGWLRDSYASASELASHFGTPAQWREALGKHAAPGKFSSVTRVHDGLLVLPLLQLVSTLSKPHFSSEEPHHRALEALIADRKDPPYALAEAAQTIDREAYPGSSVREHLLLLALAEMGSQGLPIPDGLELAPKWESFAYCAAPWRGSAVLRASYQKALRAIPRERVLGLIRSFVARDYVQSYAFPLLAIAYDESVVRQLLGRFQDGSTIDANAIAPLGAKALPMLLERFLQVNSAPIPSVGEQRKNLARCIRSVLGYQGANGQSIPDSADVWLSVSDEENYWSEDDRAIFLHMLAAMSEERRMAALGSVLARSKYVERAFLGVQTVHSPEFRKQAASVLVKKYEQVSDRNLVQRGLAALGGGGLDSFREALISERPDPKLFEELAKVFGTAEVHAIRDLAHVKPETQLQRLLRLAQLAPGPKERVYVLERQDYDETVPAARPGSYSVSRGPGPELSVGAKKDPEAEHILTFDLEEIPELGSQYPGMRALSLFARAPQDGDKWESARLIAVKAGAAPPPGGEPITVVAVDVPYRIFDHRSTQNDPKLAEIRSLLFNRPGYVLGEPIYIQSEDEGAGYDSFVMQLAERIADLNLGDSGSLYVFASGAFMQCY